MSTDGRPLYVSEHFGPTFQGEGPSAGQRAYFIRLGGCNLTCVWCDSAYTWDHRRFDLRREIAPQPVHALLAALPHPPALLVLTGGEPLLQAEALGPLVIAAVTIGWHVEVETNGTLPPPVWAVVHSLAFNVSPKLAHSGAVSTLHPGWRAPRLPVRFKFVCQSPADVEQLAAYRLPPTRIWVMPEGTDPPQLAARARALAPATLAAGYHLSPRLHVSLWGNVRGH